MSNFNTLSNNLKRSILNFSDSLSSKLSIPKKKFVRDMIFGILSAQHIQLASISRALNENIDLKKTYERLTRNLQQFKDSNLIMKNLAKIVSDKVGKYTPIIIDNTDVTKPYSTSLEGLNYVWDGSKRSTKELGYYICEAAVYNQQSNISTPVYTDLYSTIDNDHTSSNTKLFNCIDFLSQSYGSNGIYTMDRGMDSKKIYDYLLNQNLKFSIRLKTTRKLISNDSEYLVKELIQRMIPNITAKFNFKGIKFRSLKFSYIPVFVPGINKELQLVVVTGYSRDKLVLLCNPDEVNNETIFKFIYSYICRWNIEEIFRYRKSTYKLEEIRVQTLDRIAVTNMFAMVCAAYTIIISSKEKHASLKKFIFNHSKRERGRTYPFTAYFVSDGIKCILSKLKNGIKYFNPLSNKKVAFQQLFIPNLPDSYLFDFLPLKNGG